MKKWIAAFLGLFMLTVSVSCAYSASLGNVGSHALAVGDGSEAYASDGSVSRADAWLTEQIEKNSLFSFMYQNQKFDAFISSWTKTVETGTNENGKTWTVTYVSPEQVKVWVEISLDTAFAAIEYCCYFKNEGTANSPVIADILPLDTVLPVKTDNLTTAEGSYCEADDFQPIAVDLAKSDYSMHSLGGRSSSGAFPYFDVTAENNGILGGIGWTGDWKATFAKDADGVTVKAGMKETRISLYADEEMRTPAIMLMFFEGDQDAGHNKFRQLILHSYTPVDETGEPVTVLPFFMNTWGGLGEKELLAQIELCERLGLAYDALWIDAGWYCDAYNTGSSDTQWYEQLGNWEINPELFPNEFKTISQKLDSIGKELLVWFEPERAMPGTKIVNEHPEYFLPQKTSFLVYDFSSDEATDFMIQQIGTLLKENGIDWYRQDFNCDPASTWSNNDSLSGNNRVGMTEIKYITNLYRYLDGIVAMNPGLMIDNCASGGRRLDFEMMKRSVPLWRTDYNLKSGSTTDEIRSITYNLSWWLPLSAGGCSSEGRATDYHWRSMTASSLVLGVASAQGNLYVPGIEEYLELREYMTGDYYILSQGVGDQLKWQNATYEYYRPEEGDGFLMIFRPAYCSQSKQVYQLKGLEAEATYSLYVTETDKTVVATGRELMENGLTVRLKKENTSLLIRIEKQS